MTDNLKILVTIKLIANFHEIYSFFNKKKLKKKYKKKTIIENYNKILINNASNNSTFCK